MNLKGEIIAYHGWAFDSNCWKNWQSMLSNNFQFKTYDRGYFGKNNLPQFDNNNRKMKIIFAHSFGLHFCSLQQLKQANLLILFNSFSEFHPDHKKQRKRSKYALKLMIDEFQNNPETVLRSFSKKCYYPSQLSDSYQSYDHVNWEKLGKDLQLLDTSILDIKILKKLPKISIIYGSKDRIISPYHAQEFSNKLTKNSQYFEIGGVGHSLPFTDINSCLSIFNQALGDLENYGTN